MTSPIIDFIEARLDEAVVLEAHHYRYKDALDSTTTHHGERGQGGVVAWSSRVLREVEAKRRVMERHSPVPLGPRAKKGTPHSCAGCNFDYGSIDSITDDINDCPELRDLAAIWSDHPDFDPNWGTT